MRNNLHQWVIGNLLLATAIGLCGFALLSDQASADPSSPSMSSDSDICESAEDCFQAAALPKERLGKALNKEQEEQALKELDAQHGEIGIGTLHRWVGFTVLRGVGRGAGGPIDNFS